MREREAPRAQPVDAPDIELGQVMMSRPEGVQGGHSSSRQGVEKVPPSVQEAMSVDVSALSEESLLALVLRTASKRGGSAVEQARRLLASFGSLGGVARAGHAELVAAASIPVAKAAAISAAFELGRRRIAVPLPRGHSFTSSHEVYEAFAPRLAALEQETFWILLMDQRNKILRQLEVVRGSISRCMVTPQEVFAPAIREKARRMVLMHNHPSGDPEPSTEDRSLTRRLVHIAELHHIEIIDHLVFGDGRYVSFADRGWL